MKAVNEEQLRALRNDRPLPNPHVAKVLEAAQDIVIEAGFRFAYKSDSSEAMYYYLPSSPTKVLRIAAHPTTRRHMTRGDKIYTIAGKITFHWNWSGAVGAQTMLNTVRNGIASYMLWGIDHGTIYEQVTGLPRDQRTTAKNVWDDKKEDA